MQLWEFPQWMSHCHTVKPASKVHSDERKPSMSDQDHIMPQLPDTCIKELVTKGHLSCMDTFAGMLMHPLNTAFTVVLMCDMKSSWYS